MFALLRTAIGFGGSTFSLARVLAVAVPLLIASHGLTFLVTSVVYEHFGRLKERADVQAAVARSAIDHSNWLNEVADELEKEFDAFQARVAANRQTERSIDDDTSRTPDGADDVFDAGFLRKLDGIR